MQATTPVSLDPPLFHLVNHLFIRTGMPDPLAIRIQSVLAALSLFVTLWLLVRRMVGRTVAWLCVICLSGAEHFYLVEARPYAVLLAASSLALLCWQYSSRARTLHSARVVPLCGLCLAVFVATGSHYFGVLIALPFIGLELVRSRHSRRMDLPLLTAVGLGLSAVLIWLPFLTAARSFRSGYYVHVRLHDLFWAYTLPIDRHLHISSIILDAAITICLMALLAAGLVASWKRLREPNASVEEWYLLALFIVLPLFGVALSAASSGAFEGRYVIEFSIGVAFALCGGLISLVKAPVVRAVILGAATIATVATIERTTRGEWEAQAAMLRCSQSINKEAPIIFTNDEAYLQLDHMERTGQWRSPAPYFWVADMSRELRIDGTDNVDRTMLNLKQASDLPVLSYEELRSGFPRFTLLDLQGVRPRSWVTQELASDHYTIRLGSSPSPCTNFNVSLLDTR
jgi:hypothetical protein